jgi:hypothetical protein
MYFHPVWFLCRFFGRRVWGGGVERRQVDGTFGPAGSILRYLVWVWDKGISYHFWACGFWIGFPFMLSLE